MSARVFPSHKYDWNFSDVIDNTVHVSNQDILNLRAKALPLQIMPGYRLCVIEISRRYNVSIKNLLSTLMPFGLSIVQHDYYEKIEALKAARTRIFGSDFKLAARLWGTNFRMFENLPGTRKQMNCYGDPERLLAPLFESAEILNLSGSELAHVMLGKAFLKWEHLPTGARPMFENDIATFERHLGDMCQCALLL